MIKLQSNDIYFVSVLLGLKTTLTFIHLADLHMHYIVIYWHYNYV